MTRKEELLKLFEDIDNKSLIENLIDDFIFLEEQLKELRKLPMIKVHPTNPEIQKPTPASKMYKETLQQMNNTVRTLAGFIRHDEGEGESPLEAYLKNLGNKKSRK